MTKISEVKFNIFFLILALGLVFVASFLGTSLIKAQGQIKIIPTSFSGDWQNPEAVFIHNLGDLATFEKFNIENSAYPLITSQIQKTPTTKTTSISEEIVPEATTTEGISTEEMATTTKTFTSVFILSGFYVAEEFKQNKINNVQLRLSLAGKGKVGDKLVIDYYYQDNWQNLAEFNLEKEISNNLNGGYFLFDLPIFEKWSDLDNLRIRFTSIGKGQVFLDGVWLEVKYGDRETEAKQIRKTEAKLVEVKPFQIGDKKIDFTYTDDNSDENLIIKTDQKTYIGLTRAEVYFSVTNIGDKAEKINFQFYFPKERGSVKKIEKWTENIPYEVEVPDYGPVCYFCEEGWRKIIEQPEFEEPQILFQCASLGEIRNCDKLSQDQKSCILEKFEISTRKEIRYKEKFERIRLFNTPLSIHQSFFEKLFGQKIKRKSIPEKFQVKKSTRLNNLILPGQTQYFRAEIQFPPQTSGQFYIEAIGDRKGYGLLDPWWHSSWQYKKPITIDNTNNAKSLSDYQVLVEIDNSYTDFWNHVQPDGDDVRFVNTNETEELDFFTLYFDNTSDRALYWVKVDNIPASSTTTIYVYYGNSEASSASTPEGTFSYSSKVDRFYAVSDVNGNNGAKAITFFDDNDFEVGGLTDTDWDTGSADNPKDIGSTYSGEGQNAQATKPFTIEATNVNSGEMWAPASWQSKIFVTTFPRTGTNFAFYNPSDSTASITVYKNGVSQENFNLSPGSYVEKSYSHTNNAHWKIESSEPILAFQWASASYDQANIPPPAKIWHGIVRNTRVIGSEDNTNVTIYFSDGTTESNTINSTTVWTISKSGGSYGSGPSAKVVADKPVYVVSYADGNGTEMQAWYSDEDLDLEYLIPNDYDYLACSAPYDNTIITVYDMAGNQLVSSGDLGSNGADYPHHWRDYNTRSGGFRVSGNKPFYCYFEQAQQNDERNAANRVLNRKGTWPRPYVSSIGSEQEYTGSVLTQNYYRWYVNTDNITPNDPWPQGATDLEENEPIGSSYPVNSGDVLRLRISVQVSDANLSANSRAFKLQYGVTTDGNCANVDSWHDVGGISSGEAWRGYNNSTPSDGTTLPSTLLSVSDVAESYEEKNNSANNPNAINVGQDGEWDWVIEANNPAMNTEYCFRMVNSDGTLFNINNYPKLITNTPPNAPSQTKLFDNEKISDTTPSFEFSTTDISGDDLHYQIQIDDDYNFGSVNIDRNSADDSSQFENVNNPSDTPPFNNGDNIRFTVSDADALTNGTTYWWRVRAKDPNGSNEWSDWSPKRSFTIDTSVVVPTWHQTTDEQFDADTYNKTITTGQDSVKLQAIIGEYGSITLTDNNWTTVNLTNTYKNLIVVAAARYQPTADSQRAPRIRNKDSNSFEIKVDNYDGNFTGSTQVYWLAMEEGSWTIEDGSAGTKVIAGTKYVSTVYCDGTWGGTENVSFSPNFNSTPAVFHTISSNNDNSWVVTHVNNGSSDRTTEPTASQMGLAMNRSFASCSHSPEYIDYIAFDTAHGTNNGVEFDVTIGADALDCCGSDSVSFSQSFSTAPEFALDAQLGEDGGNGGYAVIYDAPTNTTFYGCLDEDGPSADRSHTTEHAAILAFDASSGSIKRYDTDNGSLISTAIDFDWGNSSAWGELSWNDNETNGDLKYQIQYWTGSSWELIPDTDLPGNSTGFDNSPVDLSGLSTTTYNQIRIKANFTYSNGSPYLQDWTVSWKNQPPTVDSISISPSPINLNADSTTTVTITATISDPNGCEDVFTNGSITGVFYDGAVEDDSCTADDNDCYPNLTFTEVNDSCSGAGDTTAEAQATVDVWFHANASSQWTAKVTATDSQSQSASNTQTVTINELAAFKLDISSIDYGTVNPNEVSTEKAVKITTTGNVAVDVKLSGTDLIWSSYTIPVSQQKYSSTSGFDWETQGTVLTTSPTCYELSTGKPTQHPSNQSEYIYWKLKVPLDKPVGTYSGNNSFDVVSDSACP